MAKPTKIEEQDQALSVYFNDMLGTAPLVETPQDETLTAAIEQEVKSETIDSEALVSHTPQPDSSPVASQHKGEVKLLLCKAAGMELAIPVSSLNNIVRWPDKALTKIPGKAEWALGLYSNGGHHTEVIDISHVLVPNEVAPSTPHEYIVLVNDYQWGIACEQIKQIVNLPADQINWRSDTDKRPWFTGILSERMSSILDIDALLEALK